MQLTPLNNGDENNFNITLNPKMPMAIADEKDSFALIFSEEDAAPITPQHQIKKVNKSKKADKPKVNSPSEIIKQMERYSVISENKVVNSNDFLGDFDSTLNDEDASFYNQFVDFDSDMNFKSYFNETNILDGVNEYAVSSPPDKLNYLNEDIELTFNEEDFLKFNVLDEA